MKGKWIAVITGAAMSISTFMPYSSALTGIIAEAANTVLTGDLNSDGRVDTTDKIILQEEEN